MGRSAILKVDILADAKGTAKGVDEADGRFRKLGSTLGKVGKIAAVGLAAGLGAAAAGAFKLAQGAAEDEAAAARLAKSLANTTGATDRQVASVERWITKQGKALGVADDELRPAMEKLAASTGDVGKAQDQVALAMDVAAGRGVSLESVTKALERANNGNVAGLSKLGVQTKNAAGETLSLEQITGKLAKTYQGQAATAANTTAGKWGRVKLQMSELGETIGAKLLPVGAKLGGWALTMAPKISRLGSQLADKLGPAFAAVGRFITTKVVPAAQAFVSWFVDKIVPGIKRYVSPILDGVKSVFGKLSDAIERNREPLTKVGNLLRVVAEFIASKVLPIVGRLIGEGFKVLGTVIGGVVDGIGKLINFIDTAVGKIKDLVGWIGKIHMPDIKVPGWLGGAVGNLTTTGVQLVGQSPSFDNRRGWTSAAGQLDGGSWSAVTRSAGQLSPGVVIVDARTELHIDNRASLTDEAQLARKIAGLLDDHRRRLGTLAPALQLAGGR